MRCTDPRLLVSILVIALSRIAAAQIQNGDLTGLITDPSGAVLAGADVVVRNVETGYEVAVRTNSAGFYDARGLIVGHYNVRATSVGFRTSEATNLVLNAGTVLRVSFQLQLGYRRDTVEVTDAAAVVNTETSRLAQTVSSIEIANLPLNGRNVYDLIQYAPGATNTRGVILDRGANTVVNGARQNFNGFYLNGVSNKGLNGGAINQPIQDTVKEFQLLTLNNSAEFGNSAGAITNVVTKSGTNHLHGSAWEFVRNDAFDANSFFANDSPDPAERKKVPLRLNQFGGTLGGPIRKGKLFFFGAYQGDRFITSNAGFATAETPQFRQAVERAFPNSVATLYYSKYPGPGQGHSLVTLRQYIAQGLSGSGYDSFAQYLCPAVTDGTGVLAHKFAALFGVEQADIDEMNLHEEQGGCPGGSIFSVPVDGAFGRDDVLLQDVLDLGQSQVADNLFNGNEASIRLDYITKQRNRFFAQFSWAKSRDNYSLPIAPTRGFRNPEDTTTPNFQLSYIQILSPSIVNEFRAGYAQNRDSITVANPGVPTAFVFDGVGTMGFGFSTGERFVEHIYSYGDSVSLSREKHNLKIGAELRRNLENSTLEVGRPSYDFFDPLFFAIDAPYREVAGVDPGIVSGLPAHLQDNTRHFRNWEVGAYVQDDWKIGRRLTLNLGLRYDLYTRHTELDRLTTTFLKGPGRNFIDNISTGNGQVKNASTPCPDNPLATVAGVCGPGGFAPAKTLGAADHNNFGPRVGFAWDMFGDGRTSLRSAFGIAYEGTLYNPLSNTRWNPPFFSLNGANNYLDFDIQNVVYGPVGGGVPRFDGPAPPEQHSGTGRQATGNVSGWDPANPQVARLTAIVFSQGLRDPYLENWFVGIQHELVPGLSMELNYVGTGGRKLYRAENINRIPGAKLPQGTCVIDNFGRKLCSQVSEINPAGRLNPNFGTLRIWQNVANSNYHGLQLSFKSQMKWGLQVSGNYTWSHSIDSGSGWHNSASTVNGSAAGDGYTTDLTMPQLDRGNSTFDIRHRLALTYVWELPFFHTAHGFVAGALQGWQLNGIWSFQSGAHWTPFQGPDRINFKELVPGACSSPLIDPAACINTGADYNLDGFANDRPNAIASDVHATHDQWAHGFHLREGFFATPCLGCVGNLGRNTFVGPGYWSTDTSLFKNFRPNERFAIQIRFEAFNIFNHTNFQLGDNDIHDPQFGQAGGTFPPRNLQFGLKLSF